MVWTPRQVITRLRPRRHTASTPRRPADQLDTSPLWFWDDEPPTTPRADTRTLPIIIDQDGDPYPPVERGPRTRPPRTWRRGAPLGAAAALPSCCSPAPSPDGCSTPPPHPPPVRQRPTRISRPIQVAAPAAGPCPAPGPPRGAGRARCSGPVPAAARRPAGTTATPHQVVRNPAPGSAQHQRHREHPTRDGRPASTAARMRPPAAERPRVVHTACTLWITGLALRLIGQYLLSPWSDLMRMGV